MSSFDSHLSTQVILEALESFVEPPIASIVIYLGLELAERVEPPVGSEQLTAFVEGPLAEVLKKRLDSATADTAVKRILEAIVRANDGAGDPRAFGGRTLEVSLSDGPVRVLICSENRILPVRLRAALGPHRVTIANAPEVTTARRIADEIRPLVVIVDAAAPPSPTEEPVADFLEQLPATCTRLVWGRELAWGKALAGVLERREVTFTPVERAEGVEPLLDLIRSRS